MLLFPLAKIIKWRPQVVICEFALGILNLPFIIFACKLLGIKLAFWSHGYDRKKGFHPDQNWVDKYRLQLMKLVNAHIVYGQEDKGILQKFIDPQKIFVAQNTLDTHKLGRIKKQLETEGKSSVKKKLGLKLEYNIVFIGRMLRSKHPEMIVEMYKILRDRYHLRIGVHFIGEGEMIPVITERVQQEAFQDDFFFHGAIYDDEVSGRILYACDLMVMPGYLGLSVNHSFCFDCPVLSFQTKNGFPAHSPEVEHVVNNKTGFLLEEHTPEAMAKVAYSYFSDKNQQLFMKKNIQNTVATVFPIEKMVEGVVDCVKFLNSK